MAISIKNATEFDIDRNIKMLSHDRKGYIKREADSYCYNSIYGRSFIKASIGAKVDPNNGCYKSIFKPYSHKRFRILPIYSRANILANTIDLISKKLEENNKTDSRYYVIYRKGVFIKIRR